MFVEALKFRFSFEGQADVLTGESGTVYKSLDARCAACVVQGGEEPPCVQEALLEVNRNEGYDCPRREWTDPYDPVAYQVAFLGSRQETAHLFDALFEAMGLDRAERLVVMRRLLRAYGDEAIASHLWPKRE